MHKPSMIVLEGNEPYVFLFEVLDRNFVGEEVGAAAAIVDVILSRTRHFLSRPSI